MMFTRLRTFNGIGLLLAFAAVPIPESRAQTAHSASVESFATARELLKRGYQLANEHRCGEARPLLDRSLSLYPSAKASLNLARCEEEDGLYLAALAHWVRARDLAREQQLSAVEAEATRRMVSLENRIPRVRLEVDQGAPGAVTVFRDGQKVSEQSLVEPLLLDPGEHVFEVHKDGHDVSREQVRLEPGMNRELRLAPGRRKESPEVLTEVSPEVSQHAPALTVGPGARGHGGDAHGPLALSLPGRPDQAPPPRSPVVTSALSVALVSGLVGAVAGVATLSQGVRAREACPNNTCGPDVFERVQTARTTGTVANVAFATAGVSLGLGLLWGRF